MNKITSEDFQKRSVSGELKPGDWVVSEDSAGIETTYIVLDVGAVNALVREWNKKKSKCIEIPIGNLELLPPSNISKKKRDALTAYCQEQTRKAQQAMEGIKHMFASVAKQHGVSDEEFETSWKEKYQDDE